MINIIKFAEVSFIYDFQMFRHSPIILAISCICTFAVFSCSKDTDSPEPELPVTPEPEPEPDPAPAIPDDSEVQYFIASLTGNELPSQGEAAVVEPDKLNNVRTELWTKWKVANLYQSDRLADPQVMSQLNFNNLTETGSWQVTDGKMSYTYATKGNKPESGYPLFIALHGSSTDTYAEWSTVGAWCAYFQDSPSAYFVPRSPMGGTGCRWYQPSRQEVWERVIRFAYLSENVNPDKIYIMGISEGGYGSQRLASFYADYLAGAGPIAGAEPFYNCPAENTANLAFCQQVGANDTSYGRARITGICKKEWQNLANLHPGYYTHKIDLQPGMGHGCDYTVTTPWLLKYTRNPHPKYVYWENFALGNVNGESYNCREGFYNLRVIEGQNGKTDGPTRDAYEMTITGNNIDLKVMSVSVSPTDKVSQDGWTVNVGTSKTSLPANKGKLRIYLDENLVDLSKPVIITVNGNKKFEGTVSTDRRTMTESLAFFFDPRRIFPASVDVTVE